MVLSVVNASENLKRGCKKASFGYYYIRLFSQTLLLLEGEKANCHFYYVEIAYYF